MLVASAGPLEDSILVDDETRREATVAIQAAYTAAIELVAPRVLARINALTAAAGSGDNDQLITDAEWSKIAQTHVEDSLGDSILDGVIAGATQFAQLANPATLVRAFRQAATGFARFASQLRSNLDTWITNQIGQGITGDWGIGRVIEELGRRSPLSPDKANVVIDSELQAANNAGLFDALTAAGVAALRWVTMRDERVRPAHEHADRDTIPLGDKFTVGGYPARFPGDPDLPFGLRVNCRCSLAYVEGTQVRRVVGSTKAELRATAATLSVSGRSRMNKGQLQHAVLAELCLQGLAGGPDCPQVFDHMNRTALLTVARGEGIAGRYRMSREQLVYELRQSVGGGDIAQTAKGYATKAEFGKSRKLAQYKRGRATVGEFSTGTTPTPEARRRSRQAVFDEFGGAKNGSVPCVHCGLRLSADATSGLAVLVPEPIIPWSEGGPLALSNMVPSCPSCFRALGGRGLVSSAEFGYETVPRDYHGRWTDGTGSVHKKLTELGGGSFKTDADARRAFNDALARIDEHKTQASWDAEIAKASRFDQKYRQRLNEGRGPIDDFVGNYTDNGYIEINDALKDQQAGDKITDAELLRQIEGLDKTIAELGTPSAEGLLRGKGPASRLRELDWHIGKEFTDPGFGSWTSDTGTAKKFTKMSDQGTIEEQGPRAVVMRLVNSGDVTSIPGDSSESESIVPRGMKYKVVGYSDYFGPETDDIDQKPAHYRIIDVEAIGDNLTAAAFTHEGAIKAWQTRKRKDPFYNADSVAEAFSVSGTKYDAVAEVTEIAGGDDDTQGWNVESTILDKDGVAIGQSSRQVSTIDGVLTVHHDAFGLDVDRQQQGIGSEYLRDSVAMYAEAGVERVTIEALTAQDGGFLDGEGEDKPTYSNGAYTWARLGFEIDQPRRASIGYTMEYVAKQVPPGPDREKFGELHAAFVSGKASIQDVAADPIGKRMLLGDFGTVKWGGHLDVKKPALAASAVPVDSETIDYNDWATVETGGDPFGDTAAFTHEGAIKAWQTRDHGNGKMAGPVTAGVPEGLADNFTTEAANAKVTATVAKAVEVASAGELMSAAIAKFGTIPYCAVNTTEALPVSGIYDVDHILVTDTAGVRYDNATDEFENYDNPDISLPLKYGTAHTVDESITGTVRHEYGHHVESQLTELQRYHWANADASWADKIDPNDEDATGGLSAYGKTNLDESFAETFSMVTHPDFVYSKVPEEAQGLAYQMLDILGRTDLMK